MLKIKVVTLTKAIDCYVLIMRTVSRFWKTNKIKLNFKENVDC